MKTKFFLLVISGAFSLAQAFAQNVVNPYEYIGEKHNEGCRYVMQNLKFAPPVGTRKAAIESILRNIWDESNFASSGDFPESPSYESMKLSVQSRISVSFFNEIVSWESFLQTNPTVASIASRVVQKESVASTTVPNTELQKYFIFLTLIKHSAQVWLPASKGGEGISSSYTNVVPASNGGNVSGIAWWKVIVSDGAGAVFGGVLGGPAGATVGLVAASVQRLIGEY